MTGKWLRLSLILSGLLLLLVLSAGMMGGAAGARGVPEEVANYAGSQACFGCHTEEYDRWEDTGHAHMLVSVFKPSDLPGDISMADAALQAELTKAEWIVAGQRFLDRDPKTGALSYLSVRWDPAAGQYVAYNGGSNWETGCAGCHSTGWSKTEGVFADAGISCEACHGPGREHILARGDRSKITVSYNAAVCGSCHNGGTSDTGTRWPDGWDPSMSNLLEVGYHLTPVDLSQGVHSTPKIRQYMPLESSGKLTTTVDHVVDSHREAARCYNCHSGEGWVKAQFGTPVATIEEGRSMLDGISCQACHDPHQNQYESQLRMPAGELCVSCHANGIALDGQFRVGGKIHSPQKEMLQGYGAIDTPKTKGAHTLDSITCVDCHMTEGNHQFKVLTPAMVKGSTRTDSCVACHTGSTSGIRAVYMTAWQGTITERLEEIDVRIKGAQAYLSVNADTAPPEITSLVGTAYTNHYFVGHDGSKGAHNFEYAMRILDAAEKALDQFDAAVGQ